MSDSIGSDYINDSDGNPAGGKTWGEGFVILWQRGPLIVDGERRPQNGAFVEHVIEAAIDRLEYYQTTKFECERNGAAIQCLHNALTSLRHRTADREARGVEGTHEV